MDGEQEALKHFKKADPTLYKVAKAHRGTLTSRMAPKRTNRELFRTLASSVVSQQLSTKAARTIWERLEAALGKVTPESVRRAPTPTLRTAGLSAAKIKTLKELASAVENGLYLPALKRMPEEAAIAELTKVWGIGTWTAEMFLIFALGRMDVFSVGDLGVLRAMEHLYEVPKGSHRDEYIQIAACWSPYRSVACLALWRHWDSL